MWTGGGTVRAHKTSQDRCVGVLWDLDDLHTSPPLRVCRRLCLDVDRPSLSGTSRLRRRLVSLYGEVEVNTDHRYFPGLSSFHPQSPLWGSFTACPSPRWGTGVKVGSTPPHGPGRRISRTSRRPGQTVPVLSRHGGYGPEQSRGKPFRPPDTRSPLSHWNSSLTSDGRRRVG